MAQPLDQMFFALFSSPSPIQAFIVGMVGSFAYCTAIRLGFIGGEQRDALLDYFTKRTVIVWFCIIGGCIAAVFQLAQITSFAPVQAFVLGITWPTLVAQYVTAAKETKNDRFIQRFEEVIQA